MRSRDKKVDLIVDDLLNRQNYSVFQANDLAKAFGGLKSFEHRVLDFCFSYVTKDSKIDDVYEVTTLSIIKHFGLQPSGDSYRRVAEALKKLNENTALYLPIRLDDGTRGIRMTQLFSWIDFYADGLVKFKFSETAAPYVIDLQGNFYCFTLGELAQIKGKYAIILMKLWEAHRWNKQKEVEIEADLETWQSWFLEKDKRLPAGQFKQKVLTRAKDELEQKLNADILITTQKRKRNIIGYTITIIDNKITDLN